MKSNKNMRTNLHKNKNKHTCKKSSKYLYKNRKQYGGSVTDAFNTLNTAIQNGQQVAMSTDEEQNQEPGDGVVKVVNDAGDKNTPIGKAINNTFNQDDNSDQSDQSGQSGQQNQQSDQLQKYLAYIKQHPYFIQSAISNIMIKPTAYLINELASLLNIDMNNPQKLKTHLDEIANSIEDPVKRAKVLNYNAQVLAVYLSASKPSIDIISGIFSQEVSEILGNLIYNISSRIQNMIPGLNFFNDIFLMISSIAQATATLSQLTSTGAISTQENLQNLNKSIMNEVDVKNKLAIEQKKQANILEKQNKLVAFILANPKIINSYIEYLNKYKNEKLTVNDIIPNSNKITDPNLDPNLDLPQDSKIIVGGKKKNTRIINESNMDNTRDYILNAIKESLNDYNRIQTK